MSEKNSEIMWQEAKDPEHRTYRLNHRLITDPAAAIVSKIGFKIVWKPNWKLISIIFPMAFLFLFLLFYSIGEVNEQLEKSSFHTKRKSMGERLTQLDDDEEYIKGLLKVEVWIYSVDTSKHNIQTEIYFFPPNSMINETTGGLLMPLKVDSRYLQTIYPANTFMKSCAYNLPLLTGSPFYYPFSEYHAILDLEIVNLSDKKLIPVDVDILVDSPSLWFDINRLPSSTKYSESGDLTGSSFHFDLVVSRPDNVVIFSMFIFILLWALTFAIVGLAITIIFFTDARPGAPYLSLGPALMFAFPNLRAAQPGTPPIGILIDVVGFFWNMALISISAVAIIYIWIKRKDSTITI